MACLIGTAHLGDSKDIKTRAYIGWLGCHNGSLSQNRGGREDHAIDIFYMPSKKKGLRRVRDRKVVFVDGKITCISCHNPYKSKDKRLIKSNTGSRLCLTCHQR
jgi:predicted CXXCH cytochrome family protein